MQILDGTGKSFRAKVNDENQLEVSAITKTIESHVSEIDGRAFTITTFVKTLNSTNDHAVLYMKNTSQLYDVKVWVINFGWNGGSTNHNRVMKWGWYVGCDDPSANYETALASNLNLKSNNDAGVLSYRWDGVGDGITMSSYGYKSAEEILGQGLSVIETHGIPIIGYNDVCAFVLKGEEIGDFVATVRFYMTERIGVR